MMLLRALSWTWYHSLAMSTSSLQEGGRESDSANYLHYSPNSKVEDGTVDAV